MVDYTQPDWEAQLLSACTGTAKGEGEGKRRYTHVLDAIGDVDATVTPISKVLDHQRSVVAAMLPLFKKQKDQETSEVYMENPVPLPEGARFVGVRTHFYHHVSHLCLCTLLSARESDEPPLHLPSLALRTSTTNVPSNRRPCPPYSNPEKSHRTAHS